MGVIARVLSAFGRVWGLAGLRVWLFLLFGFKAVFRGLRPFMAVCRLLKGLGWALDRLSGALEAFVFPSASPEVPKKLNSWSPS